MKNIIISNKLSNQTLHQSEISDLENDIHSIISPKDKKQKTIQDKLDPPEILIIASYPPRVCGIATYSQDLTMALKSQFSNSFSVKICALESNGTTFPYPDEVKYTLKTSLADDYKVLALTINNDKNIKIVLIQHEFGFYRLQKQAFQQLLNELTKPIVIVFHSVLPQPIEEFKTEVQKITDACGSIIVMTNTSARILTSDYGVAQQKISVIAHGTHLVPKLSRTSLKLKYKLKGRKVLSTFGLLSSGKGFETTIEALPAIVRKCPEVIFLVIGKTHPEVVKSEGEKYRQMLEQRVEALGLQDHVRFINKYVELSELLEYLQLTDIYLFTANDPNQAVSGTFVYAMSCGCPIISTPIPHAKEVLTKDTGIIFDFHNSNQLAKAAIRLLSNDKLRKNISMNTLQNIVSTSWENSAIAHSMLFREIANTKITIRYNHPDIKMDHLKRMTTVTGIIQFSRVNQPDISTGYTLDDNARALVATCMYFKLTGDQKSVNDIRKYLSFIKFCQQPDGNFLNYVDEDLKFTDQNKAVNLNDSNGRAIWALGYVVSLTGKLPVKIIAEAETIIAKSLVHLETVNSPRTMAFAIKGLYYQQIAKQSAQNTELITTFADRLVQLYKNETSLKWEWFEGYLTYANSTLPEAMLYAWLLTGEAIYKEIALSSLKFLLSKTFNKNGIEVISNKKWLKRGQEAGKYGEQPIDVAYTIMTLSKFYDVFKDEEYRRKMNTAFNWFLGRNRLHQIIYNPSTGGCYDGLEEDHVNLNQGAESTVSYLMARLTIEKYTTTNTPAKAKPRKHIRVQTKQRKPIFSTDYKID
ncbi:MAG TPA: glycosyltransferase [Prolixibacteraceae bacterium]|nr:glycosyltransferase [Prolixibacteraceae bacterium]